MLTPAEQADARSRILEPIAALLVAMTRALPGSDTEGEAARAG